MMEIDTYITINGVCVNKATDTNIKEELLKNEGATITKNSDASITITGPFTIEQPKTQKVSTILVNSGTITVAACPFLYGFKNLAKGTIHIKSGFLEDMFIIPAQFTEQQEVKRLPTNRPLF